MNVVAIIACRRGSSRLPDKAMKPIHGTPLITRMIERVRRATRLSQVMIATTDQPEDAALEHLAAANGIGCFRGSSDDVLGRLRGAANAASADVVVALLGDNPLIDADLIDDVVKVFASGQYDYVSNASAEHVLANPDAARFPLGVRVEVMNADVLRIADEGALDSRHREHATTYIREHPELFRLGYMYAAGRWAALNRPELNLSVNTPRNFDLMARVFERGLERDRHFSLQDVLDVLDQEPSLTQLMGA